MNKLFSIIRYLKEKDLSVVVFIVLIILAIVFFNGSKKNDNPLYGKLQENSAASSPQISNNFYLIPQSADQFYPLRDWSVALPDISAKAAIVTSEEGNKILFTNNIQARRPIASLTKLATSLVVADNLNFEDVVIISKKAVEQDGDEGSFVVGEKIKIKDLVASMLIASSNDAAYALAEFLSSKKEENNLVATSTINLEPFINLMNRKAVELGLRDTHFSSVTGLEDDENYSTAYDVSLLIEAVYKNPSVNIYVDKPRYSFKSDGPVVQHNLSNTNKLFEILQGILASKTGYTDGAGQSLGMIYKLPDGQKIIVVVLGSDDRFKDAQTLIDWTQNAYRF